MNRYRRSELALPTTVAHHPSVCNSSAVGMTTCTVGGDCLRGQQTSDSLSTKTFSGLHMSGHGTFDILGVGEQRKRRFWAVWVRRSSVFARSFECLPTHRMMGSGPGTWNRTTVLLGVEGRRSGSSNPRVALTDGPMTGVLCGRGIISIGKMNIRPRCKLGWVMKRRVKRSTASVEMDIGVLGVLLISFKSPGYDISLGGRTVGVKTGIHASDI